MSPVRWQLVQDLFARTADLPPDERAAALDTACRDDRELRVEVERLLAGDRVGDDAVSRLESLLQGADDPLVGTTLGPYRITAHVASGGMGAVYRGDRCDGLFDQEVAIKLIRAAYADDALRGRFAAERRALASLQHPCIARLYDGGTTPTGQPYFVMEYVHGEPIDRHCDRLRLPIAARLRLFLQVCSAVQFAHQNLIVHCDLKPANVLVDDGGRPRLLDFGVARLLADGRDGDRDGAHGRQPQPATPAYASPEQLAGDPVSTGHDVYSLGVVLGELLGGRPQLDAAATAADPSAPAHHGQPTAPSRRLAATLTGADGAVHAARWSSSPRRLLAAVRGDLDDIVRTATHREPARRYASVHEFALDVERHLAGLPVRAHVDAFGYRAAKFARRHRAAIAAASLVVAAMAFGLVASHRSEQRAQDEALHAIMESASFHNVADFLMDAFLPAQPSRDAAAQALARDRIVAHAQRVERQFAASPQIRANLLDALGQVCMRLDLYAEAAQMVERALQTRLAAFGAASLEYAQSLRTLGQLRYARGEFAAAADALREALRLHRANPLAARTNTAAIANDLAACLRNLGALRDAEAMHREALAERRADGDGMLPVAESLNNLAIVHLELGDVERAITELREARALRVAVLGEHHALSAQTGANLAFALWRTGERTAAFELAGQAEAAYRSLGSDGARELGQLLVSVAAMHAEAGAGERAIACLREALTLQREVLGGEHPAVTTAMARLAAQLHVLGNDREAGELWRAVLARQRATAPPTALADALYGYGVFLFDRGDNTAALAHLDEALAIHRTAGSDPATIGRAAFVLARARLRAGEVAAAREAAAAAVESFVAGRAAQAEVAMARRLLAEIERHRGEAR